jgi:HEAT repeat protein
MMFRVTVIFSIFLVLVSFPLSGSGGQQRRYHSRNSHPKLQSNSSSDCVREDEIATSLKKLASAQTASEQEDITKLLLENGQRSANCRKRVVAALLRTLDQPDVDLVRDRSSFYLWHYGTELLGELEAVEALDLLIKHLDLNDGTPFPLNHHPALGGVIRMGPVAIPKLNTVLTSSTDRYMRRYAAFCIASIGGVSARQVLEAALVSESDPCVKNFLQASLTAFQNNDMPNQISSVDRSKWYTAFLCDGT